MSKVHFILLLTTLHLIQNPVLSAQTPNNIHWDDPLAVADQSFGNVSPKMKCFAGGMPAVLWGMGGSAKKIYFTKMVGDRFDTPTEVNTNTVEPELYDYGGLDMAIAGSVVFVVFENATQGIFLSRSTDAGKTFEFMANVFAPDSAEWVTQPSILVDEKGNPCISFIKSDDNESVASLWFTRSFDQGETFLHPVKVNGLAEGDFVSGCCSADMKVQGDSVWIAFRNNYAEQRDVWMVASFDQGQTFSVATDVDPTDWMVDFCPVSDPHMEKSGNNLIATWMSREAGATVLSISQLDAPTVQMNQYIKLPKLNNGSQNHPGLVMSGDTIAMVWEEAGFMGTQQDIVFTYSTSGISGLAENVMNLTEMPGNQKMASIVFENNTFHIIYAETVPNNMIMYKKGSFVSVRDTNVKIDTVASAKIEMPSHYTNVQVSVDDTQDVLHIHIVAMEQASAYFSLFDPEGEFMKEWSNFPIEQGDTWLDLPFEKIMQGTYFLLVQTAGIHKIVQVPVEVKR